MACVGQPADWEWENKDDLCREEFQGKKKIYQTTEEKERRSAFNEIEAFVLLGFRRKKNQNFYFLNNADVENYGSFRGFGFIYIYIYIYIDNYIQIRNLPT